MIMEPLFLLESGFLGRKQNTLTFENVNVRREFPIKNFDSIYLLGEISLNTKILNYLSREGIPVFFFSYYGDFCGEFYPVKRKNMSGNILIRQVEAYTNETERLVIAKKMIEASIHNMRKTLMQYGAGRKKDKLKYYSKQIWSVESIEEVRSIEANSRKFYYSQFNKILKYKEFYFFKREYNPLPDKINCLLSFGNSLLYCSVLSEIFKTRLNPQISYVHEPRENRNSLQLDLADIFKPLIVDRVIFSLINQRSLKEDHFELKEGACYLNKAGKEVFLRKYDLKLKDTLKLLGQDRSVSYKYLLRRECFSLIDHLESGREYKPFKIWW